MAYDKVVDSGALDSNLTSVANAIRTKGGTSAQLAFPTGFVSAINAIPTGGPVPKAAKLGFVNDSASYTADISASAHLLAVVCAVKTDNSGGYTYYSLSPHNGDTEIVADTYSYYNSTGLAPEFNPLDAIIGSQVYSMTVTVVVRTTKRITLTLGSMQFAGPIFLIYG